MTQPSSAPSARVIAAHGRRVVLATRSGERLPSQIAGRRLEAVVGDLVQHRQDLQHGDEGIVDAVLPRRNLLRRQDAVRTKSFAANLDQVLVLVAADPPWDDDQLGRALLAAHEAGIAARIVLNKIDLTDAAQRAWDRLAPYRAMGMEVLRVALKADPAGARAQLAPLLDGRVTLVLGPSGMGKSTLINTLVPQADVQVGAISQALNAGRHTTTDTRWYALAPSDAGEAAIGRDPADAFDHPSALIDSPGFQTFGVDHIAPTALAQAMPDFAAVLRDAGGCRFANCTHRDEPGCAIRAAVEAGRIAETRYGFYLRVHAENDRPDWQRRTRRGPG